MKELTLAADGFGLTDLIALIFLLLVVSVFASAQFARYAARTVPSPPVRSSVASAGTGAPQAPPSGDASQPPH
jgi:hypothetical protein